MQGEVKKGGNYVLLPPFLKEGWGGGFFLPKFPLFPKEGAGGDFNPPQSPPQSPSVPLYEP